jgi:hypothetical protein
VGPEVLPMHVRNLRMRQCPNLRECPSLACGELMEVSAPVA